MKEIKRI